MADDDERSPEEEQLPEEAAEDVAAEGDEPVQAKEPASQRATGPSATVQPAGFDDLADEPQGRGPSLDLVLDIAMPVTVELGRTKMTVRDLLALRSGSVVPLDRIAGEPIELFVREVRFARGEVVVVDNSFGLRITEIVNPRARLEQLGGSARAS